MENTAIDYSVWCLLPMNGVESLVWSSVLVGLVINVHFLHFYFFHDCDHFFSIAVGTVIKVYTTV